MGTEGIQRSQGTKGARRKFLPILPPTLSLNPTLTLTPTPTLSLVLTLHLALALTLTLTPICT